MIRIMRAPIEQDLSPLTDALRQEGVPYRIIEESGFQVLLVADSDSRKRALAIAREIAAGQRGLALPPQEDVRSSLSGDILKKIPVVCALTVIALLCYPLTWSIGTRGITGFLALFLIVPAELAESGGGTLTDVLVRMEIWRLFTPALLHFGFLHLLFNLLWVWELGVRIEQARGSLFFAYLTLVLAATGNVAQYAVGTYLFGGLSGVVYGYLGFLLVSYWLTPRPIYCLRKSIVIALLVFLVLFSTNVTSLFGLHIANAAHWAGFLCGAGSAVLLRERPERGASIDV